MIMLCAQFISVHHENTQAWPVDSLQERYTTWIVSEDVTDVGQIIPSDILDI